MKNTAIIVSGGIGSRLDQNIPKQFIKIGEKTILEITTQIFQDHNQIDEIIIVINGKNYDFAKNLLSKFSKIIDIVIGGETRQQSVFNGLKAVSECDKVLIHDAARPLVSYSEISDCLKELDFCESCTIAVKIKYTIVQANNYIIENTVDRENLWQVQTPQGFKFSTIYEAHKKAIFEQKNYTDDSSMVANSKIIEGSYKNIKITTKEDLIFAQNFLSQI